MEGTAEFADIGFGMSLEVFLGLDCVFRIDFKGKEQESQNQGEAIVQKLRQFKGKQIAVPHEIGTILARLSRYPKTRAWLREQVRRGTMSYEAYRYILTYLKKIKEHHI